ncbi:hypothetical protein [Methylosinus sp. KRF6]|uniref:hypothetical protein n=1 Tax=Methylosinus sp. KRF6 TaxID=2846853 RepID=UPI001C0B8F39|nr:hypothetical protein [Methylosinus sp. KRF6]MBU3887876.1 hypothetical protein [Methylosinus sp. KRF6]
MSTPYVQSAAYENAAYGGLIDAAGGVATIVLAICGLAGVDPQLLTSIATIVFGVALFVQAGAMASEGVHGRAANISGRSIAEVQASGLAFLFLVGAAGIVLGVLALLGVHPLRLTAVAVIAFGTALLLSANATRQMGSSHSADVTTTGGAEVLANELASGSAGIQVLAGLGGIVLGLIALAGQGDDLTLVLVALLGLGATVLMTGGALSATVMSLMRPETRR